MAQAKMHHPVSWVIFAGMAALLLSQGRERRGGRSPGGRRMRGPTAAPSEGAGEVRGLGAPQSGYEDPSRAGTELGKGPQPAVKLRGVRTRARRRNSRCTALAGGGGHFSPGVLVIFASAEGLCHPNIILAGSMIQQAWGAGGAGVSLCSPHAFAFPARSSEKLGAAQLPPGWELGTPYPVCPGSARLPPPTRGMVL